MLRANAAHRDRTIAALLALTATIAISQLCPDSAAPLSAAERRALPQCLPAAAHLRAALPRDGRGRRSAGDRMIGMVLLRPGWERDYEGRPPVYPIGCSGVITHVERWPTGATTSCCAASSASASLEERTIAQLSRARIVEPLRGAALSRRRSRRRSAGSARSSRRCSRRSVEKRCRPSPQMPSAMADEDLVQRARAVPRPRTAREAGAARAGRPALARRIAGRAARDEDADGAHARHVERRALNRRLRHCRRPASVRPGRRSAGATYHYVRLRPAITSTIFSPWNRPFSMKTVPVSCPAIAPPATNSPGTLVSKVSGSIAARRGRSAPRRRASSGPSRAIAGQQNTASAGISSSHCWSRVGSTSGGGSPAATAAKESAGAGIPASVSADTSRPGPMTTDVGRISFTQLLNSRRSTLP